MAIKKKYHKRIKNSFQDIFNTDIEELHQDCLSSHINGLTTIIKEPLVRYQIIQLAKLCEEVPLNVTLKSTNNMLSIEFW